MLDKLTPKQTLSFLGASALLWGLIMVVIYIISANQMTGQGVDYNFSTYAKNILGLIIFWWAMNVVLYGYVFRSIDLTKRKAFISVYLAAWAATLLYISMLVAYMGGTAANITTNLIWNTLLYNLVFFSCYFLARYKSSQQKLLETLHLENKNTQLELTLADLRMQALQAQLEPHFLFNALHSVGGLIRLNERSKALTAISRLSDLLRFAVEVSDKKLVPLSRELAFVQDYIALQGMRFGEKIRVRIDNQCPDEGLQIPPFTLQLLMENAINHGADSNSGKVDIEVVLTEADDYLLLEVTNPQSENDNGKSGFGIGLDNLKRRLEMIYGGDFVLEIDDDNGVFKVKLKLPVARKD